MAEPSPDALFAAFCLFDGDGDGFITALEMREDPTLTLTLTRTLTLTLTLTRTLTRTLTLTLTLTAFRNADGRIHQIGFRCLDLASQSFSQNPTLQTSCSQTSIIK